MKLEQLNLTWCLNHTVFLIIAFVLSSFEKVNKQLWFLYIQYSFDWCLRRMKHLQIELQNPYRTWGMSNTPRGLVIFCYCARCLEWTWVRMSGEAIFSEFWSFWIAECWRLNTCSSLDVFIMALYFFHPHWFSLHSIGMYLMLWSVNPLQIGLQNPFRS